MTKPSLNKPRRQHIAFIWNQFAPYHVDRCEAVAEAFAVRSEIFGFELARSSAQYAWPPSRPPRHYRHITLASELKVENIGTLTKVFLLIYACFRYRIDVIFVTGYHSAELLAATLVMRLLGRRAFLMLDSKFDDKPRSVGTEFFKSFLVGLYSGALVSGSRTSDYLKFLGMRRKPVVVGYDTVSLQRLRDFVPATGAAVPFFDRPFLVIARFVPKKNLLMLLDAYAAYVAGMNGGARQLHLIGDGPLAGDIRSKINELKLTSVVLHGFLDDAAIAPLLDQALSLLLPSTEEQWGLVVNEALAFHLPILISENAGARDTLVRQGVNGFVIEPDNVAGWTFAMTQIGDSEDLWNRMREASINLSLLADVSAFVEGVDKLMCCGKFAR